MSDLVNIEQTERLLNIDSSAAPSPLILTGFGGTERLSALFSFRLEVVSLDDLITPDQLLGTKIGWSVREAGGTRRPFSGIVARFGAGASFGFGHRRYVLEVAPSFWLLTHTSNCRIFQNQTTPQIIEAVLGAYGDLAFDLGGLTGQYQPRDYCVQFSESDFAFVSRLMEDEGIFYYFKHSTSSHVMKLGDGPTAWFTAVGQPISFGVQQDVLTSLARWQAKSRFRGGRWTQRDYNFKMPGNTLNTVVETVLSPPPFKDYEYYDYPGGYQDSGTGDARTQLRMEAEEAAYQEVDSSSNIVELAAGGIFQMEDYDYASDADGSGWTVSEISHRASDFTHVTGENSGETPFYDNEFKAIGANSKFRPLRLTPRPHILGMQIATVVGPVGEEIFTDQYGRIKVQFPWDRQGQSNESSSCWLRVAQLWAGGQWGGQFIPRIGMEVLVSFLDGDPDRPLAIGCVYNAKNMPPYALTDNKTRMVLRSKTYRGEGSNELTFEDQTNQENLFLHAQKDMTGRVLNNQTHRVDANAVTSIGANHAIEVGGNFKQEVGGAVNITVGGTGPRAVAVMGAVAGLAPITAGLLTQAGGGPMAGAVGASALGFLSGSGLASRQGVVAGSNPLQDAGDALRQAGAGMGNDVGGILPLPGVMNTVVALVNTRSVGIADVEQVGVGKVVNVGATAIESVGKFKKIMVGQEFVIECGDSKFVMKNDGTVLILGKTFNFVASGPFQMKGDPIDCN